MSDDVLEAPETSSEFPTPAHFILTPVKDGAYHKGLPTITAVYLSLEKWPDGKFLMGMTGVTIDPHESDLGKILLSLFIQPEGEEPEVSDDGMQVFTDTCNYELAVDPKTVAEFLDNVAKVKSFTFAVSTEEYYFSCRVDSESTGVTDVRCDWRYLN